MFLRNQWYVAAWSEEVGRALLGRVMLGEAVVLFRREDGTPVALEDRCPHRNLPLSEGRLMGDAVECGYHGLVFDCDGQCTHVPGQADAPSWACVQRYPVVERDNRVFVWMGDPALADVATVPAYRVPIGEPDWHFVTGSAYVRAGYRLVLDNLLDLSHLTYVHGTTTGNRELAEAADLITEIDGDFVRITRWMEGIPPAPAYAYYSGKDGPIDRWQVSRYVIPSCVDITNGSTAAGEGLPQGERPTSCGRWGFVVQHAMTPETEATTHQFWAVGVDRRTTDAEKLPAFDQAMRDVIVEDLEVYEAQQRTIDLDGEAIGRDVNPKGTLAIDEALLAMRRVIRRLYGAETRQRGAA